MIEVGGARVFLGDCRDVLKTLPDNSVDSVVTDPPYELGFMGKKWDNTGVAYDVTVWEECLRVLKPGGHVLAFGGSRTWHRLAVAVEDAGFELRDSIAWIYGSGFPKSLDVSKAIDKSQGANKERQLQFVRWMQSTGLTASKCDEILKKAEVISQTSSHSIHYFNEGQPQIATAEMFRVLRPYLPEVPEAIERLVAERTGIEWTAYKQREVIGHTNGVKSPGFAGDRYSVNGGDTVEVATTLPATSEAKTWQGWGTALKPAFEPVVVGRKPLVGTVAENVLAWGVGGLNIDASRIEASDQAVLDAAVKRMTGNGVKGDLNFAGQSSIQPNSAQGRWPANVILDEVSAGLLDEQSGVSVSKSALRGLMNSGQMGGLAGKNPNHADKTNTERGHNDSGGASRFFYVAKASKRDRNEGLEELEQKAAGSLNMRTDDHAVRNGMNTGARSNFHPTVKPTQLMRYLIKLVTPAGGTVLDPFTGSGSTGKAALLDGYQFIGAELTEEYLPIIEGRLRWAAEQEGEDDDTLF